MLDFDKIKALIDEKALSDFRDRAMNNEKFNTRGIAQNDDIYFQNMEARNGDYEKVIEIVSEYMQKINEITGSNFKPFNYYGSADAEEVIIAMGSVCDTIRETIDYLNSMGKKYGVIEVHLYLPFSNRHLLEVLPKTVKKVAVLDRTKEIAASGEPLFLDVCACLRERSIMVVGGRYGLSSKDTTPADIKAIFDHMDSDKLHHNFTIGIEDDELI